MSGLISLVARGAQDVFITGKPEISFFKAAYKRHTNFSMFPVELQAIGTPGPNGTISLPIQRKGDLLSYVWADCGTGVSTNTAITTAFGMESLTPSVFRLYVGGQMIEEHDAYFASKLYPKFLANSGAKTTANRNAGTIEGSTFLPLHFSFCDEVGLSLPLVALQYHDVEIRINFNSGTGATTKYYANYIQLDTEERQALANEPREMLITQVQRIQKETDTKVDLSYFNHPVKCLLWGTSNTNTGQFSFDDLKLTLNGVDMFDPMPAKYFSHVQTYHHATNGSDLQAGAAGEAAFLYMHSFALKADKHQPCGTVNFSRLDNAEMKFSGVNSNAANMSWVYAVNYNILRIQNGMAGIAFAN